MVSSAIDMDLDELLRRLESIRKTYAKSDDADYRELRAALPKRWPV
jgi:hypothetical protein